MESRERIGVLRISPGGWMADRSITTGREEGILRIQVSVISLLMFSPSQ